MNNANIQAGVFTANEVTEAEAAEILSVNRPAEWIGDGQSTCFPCGKQAELFGGFCIDCAWKEDEPGFLQQLEQEAKEAFCIDSIERLEWYLRKIGNLEAEKARVRAQAAALVGQLDNEIKSLTGRFEPQAEQFTREELARRGGKRKSLVTLQGTCSFRTVPSRLRLADEGIALVYALKNPNAFEYVPFVQKVNNEVYRTAAEKAMQETGELLPGMEVTEARESFSISQAKT